MIEGLVKSYVARKGYGAWYQREAWERVKNMPCGPLIEVLDILDDWYPDLH